MRKNIDSSVFAGIGLVFVLLLLIGVFRSMDPISTDYVENNFEHLTFVEDGEVVTIESYEQLDAYSMDVDRNTNTVYLSEKSPTSAILPPFYSLIHIN